MMPPSELGVEPRQGTVIKLPTGRSTSLLTQAASSCGTSANGSGIPFCSESSGEFSCRLCSWCGSRRT